MRIFGMEIKRREADQAPVPAKPTEQADTRVRNNAVQINSRNADTVAAFSHAIDLRATTFARCQFEYQSLTKDDVWRKFAWGDKKTLNWLLHVKPNELQNAQQMWQQASKIRDLSHNGICCILANGMQQGRVERLVPCAAEWLPIENKYVLSNTDFNIGGLMVDAADVIVLKNGYGKSLATVLKRTLELGATADNFTRDTLGKGGTFKAIVKQEVSTSALSGIDALDDEEVEKNFDEINRQFEQGNDFIYDPSAAQITQISQSFQDLQVPMTQDHVKQSVAMVCNIPLPLMYISTNAVYKSIDDAWHTFRELTMQPMWVSVTQELNGKFLTTADYGKFRFWPNAGALCIDSDKSKAETQKILVDAGILTKNEARHALNLPAIEDELKNQD